MKKTKKILGILMILSLIVVTSIPSFAYDNGTSITAPDNRTYDIYQIMTGDYDNGSFSNLVWGKHGIGELGTAVPQDVAERIIALKDPNDIEQYLGWNYRSYEISNGGKIDVPEGYYFILDNSYDSVLGSGGENSAAYIAAVTGDYKVVNTASTVTSQKKVKDNDADNKNWGDSADYAIGDTVPFQLKAKITEQYDSYPEYFLEFCDNQDEGLTFNKDSVKVYIDGKLITSGYYLITKEEEEPTLFHGGGGGYTPTPDYGGGGGYTPTPDYGDGGGGGGGYTPTPVQRDTFNLGFADLKNIEGVKPGSEITVEYSCTVNDKIVSNEFHADNSMYVAYSNYPYTGNIGTTETDTVRVFTYVLGIVKTSDKLWVEPKPQPPEYKPQPEPQPHPEYKPQPDPEPVPIVPVYSLKSAGAGINVGDSFVDMVSDLKLFSSDDDSPISYSDYIYANQFGYEHLEGADFVLTKDGKTYTPVVENGYIFCFAGLDAGTYILKETKTPSGYVGISPMKITLSANHDLVSDDPQCELSVNSSNEFKINSNVAYTAVMNKTKTASSSSSGSSSSGSKTGSLTVSKIVSGNAADKNKEFTFKINLNKTTVTGTYGDIKFTKGAAEFTLKDGESKTAKGLPAGTEYTVTEDDYTADGYTATMSGDTGKIESGKTSEAVFKNTKNESVQSPGTNQDVENKNDNETNSGNENGDMVFGDNGSEFETNDAVGDLTVSKTVKGSAGDTKKEFKFTVKLENKEINDTYGDMSFKDGVAEFTLKDGESKTAKGLPAGTEYTVTEDDYSDDGYKTTVTGDKGKIEGGKAVTAAFTNTKNASSSGTKSSSKSPKTGDDSHIALWIILLALSAAAVTGTIIRSRKKNN